MTKLSVENLIRRPLLLCLLFTGAEQFRAVDAAQGGVSVELLSVESMFVHSFAAGNRALRIGLQIRVTNRAADELRVRRTQFRLMCEDEIATNSSMNSPEALRPLTLGQAESVEGWIWFTARRCPVTPGATQLVWQTEADEVTVSVDDFIERESQFQVARLGPADNLMVIRTRRQVDALSVQHLRQLLEQQTASPPARLVLSTDEDVPQQELSAEVFRWFYQSLSTTPSEEVILLPFPECPLKFIVVQFAGFTSMRLRNAGNRIGMFLTEEQAVAAALGDMYRHVPVGRLIEDLKSSHPGVRRAVTQSAVDRLTVPQIRSILDDAEAEQDRVATSRAIAAGLHRVADPAVFSLIGELARDPSPGVAHAAIRSLTLHPAAEAIDATLQIWEERPDLHRSIIEGAMESQDDRWGRLISDYAISLLQRSARLPDPDLTEVAPPPPADIHDSDATEHPPLPPDHEETQPDAPRYDHLRNVLASTSPERVPAVLAAACDALGAIESPGVQGVVVMFIVEHDQGEYSQIIRRFLARRIQQGALSDALGNLVYVYPDPRWTEPLLQMARNPQLSASRSQQMVQRALRCATTSQLEIFVRDFEAFPAASQAMILQQLAASRHPQWRALAENVLSEHSALFNTALDVLHTDGSEASIDILHRQLVRRLKNVGEDAEQSAEIQFCNRLISKISLFSHPDSRRLLNHCTRSRVSQIRQQAVNARNAVARRSPGNAALLKARELIAAGQRDAALSHCDEAVAADPLLAEAWTARGELLLQVGRPQEALQDFGLADGLSPDDTRILSGMALASVRTGDLDRAVSITENNLLLDQASATLRYEAACLYTQLSERDPPEPRPAADMRDRALSLLQEAVTVGFWDAKKAFADPRLKPLHDHPGWPDYRNRVLQAEKQKPVP